MLRYFFKLAFRNIRKYRVNTFISLLGLMVGLASFILIASYIKHELSFNSFNKNYNRMYVANINHYMPQGKEEGTTMPYPLAEGLASQYPEVELGVNFNPIYNTLTNGDISFFENNASYVSNSFFNVFTVKFLGGNKINPLDEPYTIVLTKKIAKKYFGEENPVGKNILMAKKYNLKVTAVIDDFPRNSDFNYDFLVSMKTMLALNPWRDYHSAWGNHFFLTIFLLNEHADYKKLNKKLIHFFDSHNDIVKRELFLSPLSKYHFKPHEKTDTSKVLVIFGLVAVFILIIACINFINLSIANTANRIKETGIRRILGSTKLALILQQIGESVLLSFISFDLAYLLAERLLPNFNNILQAEISKNTLLDLSFILSMLFIALILGVVAGIFPALKISKIKPLIFLKGNGSKFERIGFAKKTLIVIQYAVSIVLIIATIILLQQFNYIKNKNLGFNKEYLLTTYIGSNIKKINPKTKQLRDEISNYTDVQSITLSRHLPFFGNSGDYIRKSGAPKDQVISASFNMVDPLFLETLNVKMCLQKEFTISRDSLAIGYCYINETLSKTLDYENPLGEVVVMGKDKYEIAGVFSDFHLYSLEMKIPEQILILKADANSYNDFRWMVFKCKKENVKELREKSTMAQAKFFPDDPYPFFNYGSNDFKIETLNKVQGIEKTFGFFTLIAVLIASMGIFGLVALTVKQKTKEIGIRKALGSSIFSVYKLIAIEYLVLAVIGNIIAWIPALFIIEKILQDFAYRIDISFWVFVFGFFSSILLTIITIAFHTLKAARTNPVEALRYE